jgi:5-(carboxyamino)imidazole ribonucleotide synthase
MFFTAAAKKMGYQVVVWDPNPEVPARSIADSFIGAPFNDSQALVSFMSETRGVTLEWENIPADLVSEIERKIITRPGSGVLRLLQNRAIQKNFLYDHGLKVAPFYFFHNPEALFLHASTLGFPCIVKTASSGYDGQGQWHITNADELIAITAQLKNKSCPSGWVIEKKIDFQKELSVIVVRYDSGEILTYPVAENIHEQGILRISRVPAEINKEEEKQAKAVAAKAVGALEVSGETFPAGATCLPGALPPAGVFCVEMFLSKNGELLINEIAPRPHNSGHYSMDVCSVSQFEQQVRVLCGLPLIPVNLLSSAVLINILGSEIAEVSNAILSIPGIRFYDYKKSSVRPGRKMGHLLVVNEDAKEAMEQAWKVVSLLKESKQDLAL